MIAIGASGYLAACGGDDDSASAARARVPARRRPVELQKIRDDAVRRRYHFIADTAAAAGGFFKDNGLDMNLQFARVRPGVAATRGGNVDVDSQRADRGSEGRVRKALPSR
jgi:hypothetical protein